MRAQLDTIAQNPQSFREIYRRHFDFVWRCVQRLGVEPAAVDDVIQEVFLAAYRRFDTYDPERPFQPWLFGIALNVVRMARRGESRRRRRVVEAAQHPAPEPADVTRQHAALDQLQRLLAVLDDDQRTVVILIEIEGMSPRDVADGLGLSVNTVYSRLRLARAHLHRAAARQRAREVKSA
jgi:RNA polymerase sigma-70 factor (ECF subfamily)